MQLCRSNNVGKIISHNTATKVEEITHNNNTQNKIIGEFYKGKLDNVRLQINHQS